MSKPVVTNDVVLKAGKVSVHVESCQLLVKTCAYTAINGSKAHMLFISAYTFIAHMLIATAAATAIVTAICIMSLGKKIHKVWCM